MLLTSPELSHWWPFQRKTLVFYSTSYSTFFESGTVMIIVVDPYTFFLDPVSDPEICPNLDPDPSFFIQKHYHFEKIWKYIFEPFFYSNYPKIMTLEETSFPYLYSHFRRHKLCLRNRIIDNMVTSIHQVVVVYPILHIFWVG